MVRHLTILLTLGSCALLNAQKHTISIFTGRTPVQPAETVAEMQREFLRIVQPLDFDISWQDTTDSSAPSDSNQVVMIEFRGICSAANMVPRERIPAQSRSLASAAVSNGRVLPFVTIECDKLKDWIGSKVVGFRQDVRQAMLGRAMGRLLAHEVYHILAQTKHHASDGVGQSCFSLRELLAERFDFDRLTLAQMRPLPAPATPEIEGADELVEAARD